MSANESNRKLENNLIETDRLEQILAIQNKLTEADFDLYEFMNLVVDQMQSLTPATGVVLELVEGDNMVYRAANGTVKDYIGLKLPIKNSISGLCVENKEILLSPDTELDPRVNLEACRRVSARSLVVAPLITGGRAVGVLKILSDKPNIFKDEDIKILQMMSGFLASALMKQMLGEIGDFY